MRFEAERGKRLHRYFWAVTLVDRAGLELWWNCDRRRWEKLNETKGSHYSTHAPCKTLRAYERMLRKNPSIAGHSCLVNKYIGYDIYA